MSKCKDIDKLLVSYYYDELEQSKKLEIDSHLEVCSRCMASFNKLETLLDSVEVKEPEMSDIFWQKYRNKVYKKIEAKKSTGRSRLSLPKLAPAFVVLMILVLTAIGGLRLYESKQEEVFISQNYELIKDMELLEDYDILLNLEEIEAIEEI